MDTATLTHTARRILLAAAVAATVTFAANAAEYVKHLKSFRKK